MSCRKYRPSNGSEGMWFDEKFCLNCIHEKFMHTQKHGDMQCNIFNRAFLFDIDDKEYPEEWQYDENDNPTCTAWVKWNWGRDDDENGLNEPPPKTPDDPNQLCFPFIFDELGIPKIKEQLA